MATLTCKDCGYANEGERVYCHNCGAKLDRSVLPRENRKEKLSQTQKRVRKMTRPPRVTTRQLISVLILVLVWALVAAAIVQVLRTPDNVPPMPEAGLVEAPAIGLALEEALQAQGPRRLVLPQDGINAYLFNTVRRAGAKRGKKQGYFSFERVFVNLANGGVHLTVQQSVFGYPLYAGSRYNLGIRDNDLLVENAGGNFGRLPVHPALMQYADVMFKNVWQALTRERKLLSQMQSIDVGDREVIVSTRAGATPATATR